MKCKVTLERTCYSYNDFCSKKRLDIIQKRLDQENKTSDEKVKEIFADIGVDIDLDDLFDNLNHYFF